jgi:CubicO group peptidase (beta-lactamase class C family)
MNAQSSLLVDYETFVQQIMDQWHIPGLSIAVVKENQVILCRGFGFRNLAQQLPVTGETLFPIASCTKAFTALAMGMLVDEGRVDLDRPVREYMPDFQLYDAFATQRLTPRDMLCHRSGLPGHDVLWYASNFSREEIYQRLRYLEPTRDLRMTFQYQNLMYVVVGLLIERVTGLSWEEFIRSRIFAPLEMRRSGFSTTLLQQDPDHSRPYFYWNGETQEIPYFDPGDERNVTAGAGSIVSCAADLSRWLLLQLQGGKWGERNLISPGSFQQMHQPHIFIDDPAGRERYGFEFNSAALGWFTRLHKGQVLVSHDGIADGFASFIAMLPRRNLGVALLSNLDFNLTNFSYPLGILAYTLFDRLLGLEATDWQTHEKAYYDSIIQSFAPVQAQESKEHQGVEAHQLAAFEGDYQHPGYGMVTVRKNDRGITVCLNGKLAFPIVHKDKDIFEVTDERFGTREKVTFTCDDQGCIASLSVRMDPVANEAVFTRVRKER